MALISRMIMRSALFQAWQGWLGFAAARIFLLAQSELLATVLRDDVGYILETFPIIKRKDMQKHGEYRTRRVILETYDAMAAAMAGGPPYQTRLDPPREVGQTSSSWSVHFKRG
jgi:hypothetical protein